MDIRIRIAEGQDDQPFLLWDTVWDASRGFADWRLAGSDQPSNQGGLSAKAGLATSVILSLFTDKRCPDDHPLRYLAGDDRRGWWGDGVDVRADLAEQELGSLLWLFERAEASEANRRWVETLAYEALTPLLKQGAVARIETAAKLNEAAGRIELLVRLYGRDGKRVFDLTFEELWKQTATYNDPPNFGQDTFWMFDWSALDLDFSGDRYAIGGEEIGILDIVTVTRNSPGMAQRLDGTWVSFAANEPRRTDKGLLVEGVRTNLFLNSTTPVAQTITVTAGSSYSVSLWGAGSLTLTGAASGTVTEGAPVTFSASGSSLTVTPSGVSGSFVNVNVEQGTFATSPIITGGAAVTREADSVVLPLGGWFNPFAGTLYADATGFDMSSPNQAIVSLDDGTANMRIQVRRSPTGAVTFIVVDGLTQALLSILNPMTVGTRGKVMAVFEKDYFRLGCNKTLAAPDLSGSVPAVTRMVIGGGAGVGGFNGYLGRVAYGRERLSADLVTRFIAI